MWIRLGDVRVGEWVYEISKGPCIFITEGGWRMEAWVRNREVLKNTRNSGWFRHISGFPISHMLVDLWVDQTRITRESQHATVIVNMDVSIQGYWVLSLDWVLGHVPPMISVLSPQAPPFCSGLPSPPPPGSDRRSPWSGKGWPRAHSSSENTDIPMYLYWSW